MSTTVFLSTFVLGLMVPAFAQAQAPAGANDGGLTFTGALDIPSVYFFRGIRQEGDPKLTLWPSGTVSAAIGSSSAVKMAVDVGIWESLHTGTSGTGGPEQKLQYEEDFSVGTTLDLHGGIRVRPAFMAYTSPNGSFHTIQEITLQVAQTGRYAPYGLLAFELSDEGQRDEGSARGTYPEIGGAPHWTLPIDRLAVTVPVKAGFSLKDYYELFGSDLHFHDHKFGFFDLGGLVRLKVTSRSSRFGVWEIHGGADALWLGTTPQALNKGNRTAFVVRGGVGVVY